MGCDGPGTLAVRGEVAASYTLSFQNLKSHIFNLQFFSLTDACYMPPVIFYQHPASRKSLYTIVQQLLTCSVRPPWCQYSSKYNLLFNKNLKENYFLHPDARNGPSFACQTL
jgi:hypothetical protein